MIKWFFSLPIITQGLFFYLAILNIVTFFYFGYDKMQSFKKNRPRISEKTLWFLSLIGGSLGALLGMHYFRHKTKKVSFQAVMAVILAGQVGIVFYLFQNI